MKEEARLHSVKIVLNDSEEPVLLEEDLSYVRYSSYSGVKRGQAILTGFNKFCKILDTIGIFLVQMGLPKTFILFQA